MSWLSIVRLAVLIFTIVCGVIAVGLAAHITSASEKYFDGYFAFSVLGVVAGGLTVITVPIMLIVDLVRTGAFTSLVVVELSWLSILWVLWLATGALTADQTSGVFSDCDFVNDIINQYCHETQALEAFAWLAWIILLAYTITLLVVAIVNTSRGQPMWMTSVSASGGVARSNNTVSAVEAGAGGVQTQQYQQQQQPLMAPATGVMGSPNPYQPQQIQPVTVQGGMPQPQVYGAGAGYPPQSVGTPASGTAPSQASYPQV